VGNFQLPDHFNGTVSGLRDRGRESGEDGPCGVLCIKGVRLAVQAAEPAVRTGDFDDLVPISSEERGETGPVGTGALDAERDDRAERGRPVKQLLIAAVIRRDRQRAEDTTDGVDDRGEMNVFVGVDADDDVARSCGCFRCHAVLPSCRLS
jgi:hypothetical protein